MKKIFKKPGKLFSPSVDTVKLILRYCVGQNIILRFHRDSAKVRKSDLTNSRNFAELL